MNLFSIKKNECKKNYNNLKHNRSQKTINIKTSNLMKHKRRNKSFNTEANLTNVTQNMQTTIKNSYIQSQMNKRITIHNYKKLNRNTISKNLNNQIKKEGCQTDRMNTENKNNSIWRIKNKENIKKLIEKNDRKKIDNNLKFKDEQKKTVKERNLQNNLREKENYTSTNVNSNLNYKKLMDNKNNTLNKNCENLEISKEKQKSEKNYFEFHSKINQHDNNKRRRIKDTILQKSEIDYSIHENKNNKIKTNNLHNNFCQNNLNYNILTNNIRNYYSYDESNNNGNNNEKEYNKNRNLNCIYKTNTIDNEKNLKNKYSKLERYSASLDCKTKSKISIYNNTINNNTINNNKIKENNLSYEKKKDDISNLNKKEIIKFNTKKNNNLITKNDNFLSNKKKYDPNKKTNCEVTNNEIKKQNKKISTSFSVNNLNIPKFYELKNNMENKIFYKDKKNNKENDEISNNKPLYQQVFNTENQTISNLNNYLPKKENKKENDKVSDGFSEIFEKLNIFNSILLLLSNIKYTTREMNELNKKNSIFEKDSKKYGLSFILYQLNRYFLKFQNTYKITKNKLKFNYEMHIKQLFIESNDNCSLEKFLTDVKNAQFIFGYILKKIHNELDNQSNFQNNNKCCGLVEFYLENPIKYSSFISENFTGNCITEHYNSSSTSYFNFVFDLNEISKNNIVNDCLKTINLTDCFQNFKNKMNSNIEPKINSLPNVLTIILKPYNFTNIDFRYPDELCLNEILFFNDNKKYKLNADGVYLLVGLLCKYSHKDKFKCLYINQNNGIWCYRKNRNIFGEVKELDMNKIPIILFYQKRNSLEFEYRKLKKDKKSILLFFNYMDGFKKKFYVAKELKVSQIFNLLLCNNSIKNISCLLVNGKPLELKKTFQENGVKYGDNIIVVDKK